jgi:hypothetical protein
MTDKNNATDAERAGPRIEVAVAVGLSITAIDASNFSTLKKCKKIRSPLVEIF